jgi:hypothetical protein
MSYRAPFLLVLVLLALAAYHSARLGVSGLVVELAQSEIDRWSASKRRQPMAEVSRVAGYFTDSLRYLPHNPWALEGLASLDLARVRLSREPSEALAFAHQARAHFRKALAERPTSPFLWANLALSKLYLDQADAELSQALRQADALGPWEPATQQVVLFVALAAWDKLDAATRAAVQAGVQRASVRNARQTFDMVKSYGRLDLVCGLRGYDVVAAADCSKGAKYNRK